MRNAVSLPRKNILPGFGLTLGFTLCYLSLIVLLPLAATFVQTSKIGWHEFWRIVTAPRALAAYGLSFGAALIAGAINFVVGTLVAWVLVRYSFPFKRILDSLVDLPFALPTAVAGIALTTIYAPNGLASGGRWRPWSSRCLYATRHRDRFDVHRIAVRRAHGPAGSRGPR